jgi:hypothetical protein
MFFAVSKGNKEMVVCLVEELGQVLMSIKQRTMAARFWGVRRYIRSSNSSGTCSRMAPTLWPEHLNMAPQQTSPNWLERRPSRLHTSRSGRIAGILAATARGSRSAPAAWRSTSAPPTVRWQIGRHTKPTASDASRRNTMRKPASHIN